METMIALLGWVEDVLWGYLGFPLILGSGLYFTWKSKGYQFHKLPHVIKRAWQLTSDKDHKDEGLHPLKAFFASIGGAVGIGNLVGICSAIKIGGPGALFWIWVVAILGVLLKYTEVYLGHSLRVKSKEGGYDGGPMYYLPQAFGKKWGPLFASSAALLLCFYGVEIYQFNIVRESLVENWNLPSLPTTLALLALVMFSVQGGLKRVGDICSMVIPAFIFTYFVMAFWILAQNFCVLPELFATIMRSAFTGHAAVGGFLGSSFILTVSQGLAMGCYASDVGIGYTSIIHSTSREKHPEKQAALTLIGILLDVLGVCTLSMLLILVTGVWQEPIEASMMVQRALSMYFPYMHYFMPVLLFLLGYSTVIAFFCVGMSCAKYLSPKYGKALYLCYGALSLFAFSFYDTSLALSLMIVCGGFLLLMNLISFIVLRKKVHFK